MPQQPNTGDAGSTHRPRAMDAQRGAAWKAALKKRKAGREVWDMPAEEHAALLRPGLFEDLDAVAAHEEAAYVVPLLAARIRLVAHRPAGSHHCGPVAPHQADIRRTARRGGAAERHPGQQA